MIDALTEVAKQMESRYRCFGYCKQCNNRNDSHYGNCIECCPVRRGEVAAQNTVEAGQNGLTTGQAQNAGG